MSQVTITPKLFNSKGREHKAQIRKTIQGALAAGNKAPAMRLFDAYGRIMETTTNLLFAANSGDYSEINKDDVIIRKTDSLESIDKVAFRPGTSPTIQMRFPQNGVVDTSWTQCFTFLDYRDQPEACTFTCERAYDSIVWKTYYPGERVDKFEFASDLSHFDFQRCAAGVKWLWDWVMCGHMHFIENSFNRAAAAHARFLSSTAWGLITDPQGMLPKLPLQKVGTELENCICTLNAAAVLMKQAFKGTDLEISAGQAIKLVYNPNTPGMCEKIDAIFRTGSGVNSEGLPAARLCHAFELIETCDLCEVDEKSGEVVPRRSPLLMLPIGLYYATKLNPLPWDDNDGQTFSGERVWNALEGFANCIPEARMEIGWPEPKELITLPETPEPGKANIAEGLAAAAAANKAAQDAIATAAAAPKALTKRQQAAADKKAAEEAAKKAEEGDATE